MSMTGDAAASLPRARRNVAVLSLMHAVLGAQLPACMIMGGLAGLTLAENRDLATLPIAAQMVAAMLAAAPVSLFMGRFGRKPGFALGALCGAAGAALAALAMLQGAFWLLCLGHGFIGLYQSTQNYFRFAAADAAPDQYKPRAISLVLAGGLAAALIGPEIVVRLSQSLGAAPFAGAYAALIALNALGALAIPLLDLPRPKKLRRGDDGRPLPQILRETEVPAAMLCAMMVYGLMTLVMTATPLAMVACGYGDGQAADVVRWHVLAMFAPSFFTGNLIARFGHGPIVLSGLAMLTGCALLALAGVALENFYGALILLGLGWNFGFIGATSLLATQHRPEESAKVQGLNDFLVMSAVAAAALGSGKLMAWGGWALVLSAAAPPILLAGLALLWLSRRGGRRRV